MSVGGLLACGSEKQFQLKELHIVELEHNQWLLESHENSQKKRV